MLTVAIVLFAGIIIAVKISSASSKIAEFRAQPRLVLHYPAKGPSPVALTEVTEQTFILDRKLAGLVQRRNQGQPLDERELALVAPLDSHELRIGDTLHAGWTGKPIQRLPLGVRVKSKEYAALLAELEARAVADPHLVAEALLAAASPGQLPTLCTVDLALRNQLSGAPTDPYREESVDVGVVTFSGRSLRLRQFR